MNLPDVTLLLQIINFTIAYTVMRKFVFVPVLNILLAQDLYKKTLEKNIDAEKIEQQNVQNQQRSRWQSAKESLYQLIPNVSFMTFFEKSFKKLSKIEPKILSVSDKKLLVEKLSKQLSDVQL